MKSEGNSNSLQPSPKDNSHKVATEADEIDHGRMEANENPELEKLNTFSDSNENKFEDNSRNTMSEEHVKITNGNYLNCKTNPELNDQSLTEDIDRVLRNMPLTDDTSCGFWILKGSFFQKFANKKVYVVLYGIVGCIFSMTYAYFNGTLTTMEKRYKIPSRNTGIITVGNDISQLFVSGALSYYAGKGHRPRWIGFGLLTIVAFCLLTAVPHFIYGPGEDALLLTKEYGGSFNDNNTLEILKEQKSKMLCRLEGKAVECETGETTLAPQIILFIAQFISGIGGSLYYTLGVSYMDDNIKKSKTPALLSLSYFMRMLGPAIGYALASFCLRLYISPNLSPVITKDDPRWLGAWWLGWIILGTLLFTSGIFLSMFPRTLPRAAARKLLLKERMKKDEIDKEQESELPASFKDMIKTFKKLVTNPTLMCNNISSIFYFFGYMPYWIFTPKYIEIQYRQSASTSSLVTGTVALVFSAIGVLGSGFIISKYKPRARYMAAWNVLVGFSSIVGILSYSLCGCPANESSMVINNLKGDTSSCNFACQCDYVRYSPICGEDGNTYISACHAGCKKRYEGPNKKEVYYDCACITPNNETSARFFEKLSRSSLLYENKSDIIVDSTTTMNPLIYGNMESQGQAIPGACPVDCFRQFVIFLSIMCVMKFIGSTGRASNFLVSVRCVPEKDKTASMGFSLMLMSLFAFIPSPIFFGWILDSLCLVWGKTCSGTGNCWLYDAESLRFTLNVISSGFVAIGTLFDIGVWYYVKDLKIFDEECKETELHELNNEEDATNEKKAEI